MLACVTMTDPMEFMVMSAGGMVPSIIYAMQAPSLAMYRDGRILTALPDPALQSVPARYEVTHVDPDVVRQFLVEARSGGLLGGHTDFGTPRMTDLATTTVLVRGEGPPAQVRVYALSPQFETKLSVAQRDARDRLRALIDQAAGLPGDAARQPYAPGRVAVYETATDGGGEPATATWPGPPLRGFLAPSTTHRSVACGEITGAAADVVYRAALQNPGARWLVEGSTRVLAVNPLPVNG